MADAVDVSASGSAWLDVRSAAAGSTTSEWTGAALARPPASLSPAWRLLLFGDGSPTLSLSLACGAPLTVDVVGSAACLDARDAPPLAAAVPAPLVRRAVWLVCGGARVGYACSWWSAGDLARLLPDAAQPIGAALARAHVELRRELLAVTRTAAHAALDEAFGVARGGGGGGDALWARWYLMYERGRAFALVHEVFSPRLQREGLGPSEVGSG